MLFLRQVMRSAASRPASSALIIGLAALGIALSTAMFAIVETVLLRPLPYRDADRLVKPWCVAESFGVERYPFSWENYRDYRNEIDAFDGLAATRTTSVTLDGESRPTSVTGARVTENLFEVLGVSPTHGRLFRIEADGASETNVALIAHGLWQRVFAGADDIVGRSIRLDGAPHTIIGVLPPHLRYPRPDVEVFVPLVITDRPENVRAFHFLNLVARLKDGASLEDADAQMKILAQRLAETYPDANLGLDARVIPLKEELVGTSRGSLGTLFSAVQLLFCIAWANVSILLLVRGMARRRELEVRVALGASRRRLFALLLGEAGLLVGLGGIAGLVVGYVALAGIEHIDPQLLPRAYEVRFQPSLALWTLGMSTLGVFLFGSLPAWAASRTSQLEMATTRTTDRRGQRWNTRLAAAQVALVVPLLVASGMQLRSVWALAEVHTGFNVDRTMAAGVALPVRLFNPEAQERYIDRAIEALEELPRVSSAGAMSHLPLTRRVAALVTYRPEQEGEAGLPNAHYRVITAGLLQTLGVPVVSGREFEPGDVGSDRSVVILDETLARTLFPDRDPIGQKVRLGSNPARWDVIGVAGAAQLVSLDEEPDYTVYVPVHLNFFPTALATPKFVLRTRGAPSALVSPVRETLQAVDPDQAVLEVRPLAAQLDDWLIERRAVASLLWILGAAALVLAAAGIYATLAFAVGRRLREMAIRSAMGAGHGRLAGAVLSDGVKPALVGSGLGLALGVLVGKALETRLYGVTGIDVPSLVVAIALIVAASVSASIAPARRAVREDPAKLLRDDEPG